MSLPVFFEPNIDLYSFKKLLLQNGYAERVVYYDNGDVEIIPWVIYRLDLNSNLLSNIYSYHRFRNWKLKGIEKVVIKTASLSLNTDMQETSKNEEFNNQKLNDEDLEKLLMFAIKIKSLAVKNNENFSTALIKCLSLYAKSKFSNNNYYAKALHKIKKWAYSPNQNNYKVIKSYFLAFDEFDSSPSKYRMFQLCSDPKHPELYVKNFQATYASLKVDGVTTNGKIFEDDGHYVDIWEVVKDELMKYKDFFLGNEKFSYSSNYDSIYTDSFLDNDEFYDEETENIINNIIDDINDDDF